jgi:hypothetical protein
VRRFIVITTPLTRRCRLPALAALFVTAGWLAAGSAGAAITSFSLSPTSGPPGTVVNVSGADCKPGLTTSASNDYVAVAAPSMNVSLRVPVAPNGSWQGSFTVPADASSAPSSSSANPVVALCVSDTLPSLTTVYMPQTFAVTAPPTTTPTTTTAPGSTKPTTPTTKPHEPGSTTPPTEGGNPKPGRDGGATSTVPFVGAFPPGPSGGGAGPNPAGPNRRGATTAGPSSTQTEITRAALAARAARAADLSVPELPAAHVNGAGGLGWLSWLLLLALVVAAFAAPLWLRRSREQPGDAAGLGDAPGLGDVV